jgi:hypothetical protein
MIRKLESREESEKRQRRNTLVISIILIAILVFSTAGYFSLSSKEEKKEGESAVQEMGNEWVMKYGEQILKFSSPPEAAKNTSIMIASTLENYYEKSFYIVSESDAAYYEIAYNLGRVAGRIQPACYGKCERNLPEKNCSETLIIYNQSGQNRVYQDNNCVFIEGSMSAVDAFLYRIFGVI